MLVPFLLALSMSPARSQYVMVDSAMTWSDANAFCAETYGTSLATIKNDYDAEKLLKMATGVQFTGDAEWIGLNDLEKEGEFEWASGFECDGDCSSLEWWFPGQPNSCANVGDANCHCSHIRTAADSTAMIVDTGCDNSRKFVCDEPPAWGQYVFVDIAGFVWAQANDHCAEHYGTTLATIKNDEDANALYEMKYYYDKNFWIGLHDSNTEGTFEWLSGFPCDDCSTFDYWYPDEPESNGEDQHCVRVKGAADGMYSMLDNIGCNNPSIGAFVCDAPILGIRVGDVESELLSVESELSAIRAELSDTDTDTMNDAVVEAQLESLWLQYGALSDEVESLENLMKGFQGLIEAHYLETDDSESAPIGLSVFGEYALYAVVLLNVSLLLCFVVYCVYRRHGVPLKYNKVIYDTDTDCKV